MTHPREHDPDAASGARTPPPGPWWSSPKEQWDAPSEPSAGADQPSSGQPSYGQQPYGSYAQDTSSPAPDDPWRSPGSTAVFGTGAQAWGYPTDSIGARTEPAPPRRGRLATLAGLLALALLSGGVGGYVGSQASNDGALLDPTASLGTGGATSAPAVDRAPDSIAGIAAEVMKSTVSIAVSGADGNGTGSGVVIRSDGYVLTNNHVVAGAQDGGEITVTFDGSEGRPVPARIVGLDPVTDLAVLRIDVDRPLDAASLGQSRSLVVGDPVIAIGSPLGLSGTVTTGIVSALNRTVDVPSEGGGRNPLFNAVQTDAAINPGNSGGALVNNRGEVIGINSAIATLGGGGAGPFGGEQAGGSIGVGFAIPIDEARSVAEEIIRTGRATHPAIGVSARTISAEEDQPGARVRELTPGGAAAAAGLQVGDLIVMVDDVDVTTVDELILAVRENGVGDTVTLTYVRDGATRTAELVLQDLPVN